MHAKHAKDRSRVVLIADAPKAGLSPNRKIPPTLLALLLLILNVVACGSNYSNPDQSSKEHPVVAILVTANPSPAIAVNGTVQLSASAGYGGYPDGIRQIIDPYFAGRRDEAMAAYARWLPLINYENRQCGLHACKVLMKEGGVIGSEMVRHPLQRLHPKTRAGLVEIARLLDPVVLRWGH